MVKVCAVISWHILHFSATKWRLICVCTLSLTCHILWLIWIFIMFTSKQYVHHHHHRSRKKETPTLLSFSLFFLFSFCFFFFFFCCSCCWRRGKPRTTFAYRFHMQWAKIHMFPRRISMTTTAPNIISSFGFSPAVGKCNRLILLLIRKIY